MREPSPGWEVGGVTLLVWLGLLAVSVSAGGLGLSWDALNHHIYLGWTAEGHRLDQDALAAAFQSLQFPYLYWPAYKLAILGAGPVLAAAVLSAFHALAAPAVWLIARVLIPEAGLQPLLLRTLAVILGFLTPVILALSDNTANDLLAATPLVWAVALALEGPRTPPEPAAHGRRLLLSGLLAGVATACKFSNGPIALLLPVLWALPAGTLRARATRIAWAGTAAVTGFALAYGHWGWQLWVRFGNPIYPFADPLFAPLRRWLGWGA